MNNEQIANDMMENGIMSHMGPIHTHYMDFVKNFPEVPFEGWLLTLNDEEFEIILSQVEIVFIGREDEVQLGKTKTLLLLTLLYHNGGVEINMLDIMSSIILNRDELAEAGFKMAKMIKLIKSYKDGHFKYILDSDGNRDFNKIEILNKFKFLVDI